MSSTEDHDSIDPESPHRQLVVVKLGQIVVTDEAATTLATPALASAVAIALHHAESGTAGLMHFLLPHGDVDPTRRAAHPELFADSGFALLLDRMVVQAGGSSGVAAWVVGGADLVPSRNEPSPVALGLRNVEAADRLLAKAGIEISGRRVGGHRARRLLLDVDTGKARITETPTMRRTGALSE